MGPDQSGQPFIPQAHFSHHNGAPVPYQSHGLFFRRRKPQTTDFLLENQVFAFSECGGEGEIRTLNFYKLWRLTPP